MSKKRLRWKQSRNGRVFNAEVMLFVLFLRDKPRIFLHPMPVHTIILDTHGLINDLTQRGFTDKQAEGVIQAIKAQNLEHLATKADLQDEIRKLEIRLLKWIVPVLLGQIGAFALVVKWLLA